MSGYKLAEQLTVAIDLLISHYPQGLSVLLGQVEPPTSQDIAELVASFSGGDDLGVRVDGGESVPEAERMLATAEKYFDVIEKAGGWDHIVSVVLEWSEHYSKTWGIIVDHVRWVQGGFSRVDESQLDRIAKKHHTTIDTVCRKKREFPSVLARAILRTPKHGDNWNLKVV